MLNKIIQFSIKNKLLVGLLVIGLIVYGSYQITKLPIDAVPDITDNQVQILTISSSMGATDVERLVNKLQATLQDLNKQEAFPDLDFR